MTSKDVISDLQDYLILIFSCVLIFFSICQHNSSVSQMVVDIYEKENNERKVNQQRNYRRAYLTWNHFRGLCQDLQSEKNNIIIQIH